MNRATQIAAELQILRVLCDEAVSRELRLDVLKSYSGRVFIEPQHQVVFESIRQILGSGSISVASLTVHLNNRGFPDIDTERYFTPATRAPKSKK